MSRLIVTTVNAETYNTARPQRAVTANSVVAGVIQTSGNVNSPRIITSGSGGYQFIERIPLENMEMANTSNISGYSSINIIIESLLPANTSTTGPKAWLQVSCDGGTVYANSNTFHVFTLVANNFVGDSVSQSDHPERLTTFGIANLSNSGGCSGIVTFAGNKAGVTTRYDSLLDYRSGETDQVWNYQERGFGKILLPSKITNYRIRLTEGSLIANGTLTIEGIPG